MAIKELSQYKATCRLFLVVTQYEQGEPLISDEEYDQLKNTLHGHLDDWLFDNINFMKHASIIF